MACEMLKHNGFVVVDEIRGYRKLDLRDRYIPAGNIWAVDSV